jgi:hypothetical protein
LKKPPSKDLGGFPFTLLHQRKRVCNLPGYVARQKEADDSQNQNDSCCHCTPSRSKFRRFSTSVSFEEQPPVSFGISPYDCAFKIFGVFGAEF